MRFRKRTKGPNWIAELKASKAEGHGFEILLSRRMISFWDVAQHGPKEQGRVK